MPGTVAGPVPASLGSLATKASLPSVLSMVCPHGWGGHPRVRREFVHRFVHRMLSKRWIRRMRGIRRGRRQPRRPCQPDLRDRRRSWTRPSRARAVRQTHPETTLHPCQSQLPARRCLRPSVWPVRPPPSSFHVKHRPLRPKHATAPGPIQRAGRLFHVKQTKQPLYRPRLPVRSPRRPPTWRHRGRRPSAPRRTLQEGPPTPASTTRRRWRGRSSRTSRSAPRPSRSDPLCLALRARA